LSRLRTTGTRHGGVGPIAFVLAVCTLLLLAVLKTAASYDVVNAPRYIFMYIVLGIAWLRIATPVFSLVGVSVRDDVIERDNRSALLAVSGGILAVTFCYAGGNIGDGPGWWVVVFSAGLATAVLMLAWMALGQFTTVHDAVTVDRDPAAGVRLGGFLTSCGLVLGRAVAGDWQSGDATVADVATVLPVVLLLVILAVVIERRAKPSAHHPHVPMLAFGIAPAVLYVATAAAAIARLGWPA
jgi:hypothetical protein